MKTPEEMAEEYTKDWWGNLPEAEGMRQSAKENFLAGYHTAYNIAYELGFEEALKAQKTLTYIQTELKKTNENP